MNREPYGVHNWVTIGTNSKQAIRNSSKSAGLIARSLVAVQITWEQPHSANYLANPNFSLMFPALKILHPMEDL